MNWDWNHVQHAINITEAQNHRGRLKITDWRNCEPLPKAATHPSASEQSMMRTNGA